MLDQATKLREVLAALPIPKPSTAYAYAVAVASGKGGVGKTTVSVNLALALGEMGYPVLLWDADFSLANANILLNLTPKKTVQDVLAGTATLEEVLLEAANNVWLLPGASGIAELARLDGHSFSALCARLMPIERRFAVVLADTAAGIGPDVLACCLAAQELLLVTTPEPTALTDAYGLLKAFAQRGANHASPLRVNVIVNMVNSPSEVEVGERLCTVARRFLGLDAQVVSFVPFSLWVQEAVRRQVPLLRLVPSCPTAKSLRQLAHTLAHRLPKGGDNQEVPPSFMQHLFGFFQRVMV